MILLWGATLVKVPLYNVWCAPECGSDVFGNAGSYDAGTNFGLLPAFWADTYYGFAGIGLLIALVLGWLTVVRLTHIGAARRMDRVRALHTAGVDLRTVHISRYLQGLALAAIGAALAPLTYGVLVHLQNFLVPQGWRVLPPTQLIQIADVLVMAGLLLGVSLLLLWRHGYLQNLQIGANVWPSSTALKRTLIGGAVTVFMVAGVGIFALVYGLHPTTVFGLDAVVIIINYFRVVVDGALLAMFSVPGMLVGAVLARSVGRRFEGPLQNMTQLGDRRHRSDASPLALIMWMLALLQICGSMVLLEAIGERALGGGLAHPVYPGFAVYGLVYGRALVVAQAAFLLFLVPLAIATYSHAAESLYRGRRRWAMLVVMGVEPGAIYRTWVYRLFADMSLPYLVLVPIIATASLFFSGSARFVVLPLGLGAVMIVGCGLLVAIAALFLRSRAYEAMETRHLRIA